MDDIERHWWEQLTWQSGEEAPRRQCSQDCYGSVHTDVFLMWRDGNEPAVVGVKDLRALLVAREFLNEEQLGEVVIRSAKPIMAPEFGLSEFSSIVKAWLNSNQEFNVAQLKAQLIRVQYVRPEH